MASIHHQEPHNISQTIAQLYASDTARLHAILLSLLGASNLPLVQDIVQESFVKALHDWEVNGLPNNPAAWLVKTAKNAAFDALRSDQVKRKYAETIAPELQSNWTLPQKIEAQFAQSINTEDAQLNMLIWLSSSELDASYLLPILLRLVCGLSIEATCRALLISEANLKKRLLRGQQQLKEHKFSLDDLQLTNKQIDRVHTCLYLLFTAGLGAHHHKSNQESLALIEALNLTQLLLKVEHVNPVKTQSLFALMNLYLARQSSRYDDEGNIIPLHSQDRSKWRNKYLLTGSMVLAQVLQSVENAHTMRLSSHELYSAYLYEALVANEHLRASSLEQTDYKQIAYFYEQWYKHTESPVVAINLCIAKSHCNQYAQALSMLNTLKQHKQLKSNYQVDAAFAYIYAQYGKLEKAWKHFEIAKQLGMDNKEVKVLKAHIERKTMPNEVRS